MKRVIFWVDFKPTTFLAGFYANEVSVKGRQVETNVEYLADHKNLRGDCGLSPVQRGNATSTSLTIRQLKWNVWLCVHVLWKIYLCSTCIYVYNVMQGIDDNYSYVCICTYYNRHTFVPTNFPPSSYIILMKTYMCVCVCICIISVEVYM